MVLLQNGIQEVSGSIPLISTTRMKVGVLNSFVGLSNTPAFILSKNGLHRSSDRFCHAATSGMIFSLIWTRP